MSARSQPDFSSAISRFRAIATVSGDALLTEGEVHPDRDLLALCAEAHDMLAASGTAVRPRQCLAATYQSDLPWRR